MKPLIIMTISLIAMAGSFIFGYIIGETNERESSFTKEKKSDTIASSRNISESLQKILNKKPYPDGSQYLIKEEWESLCAAAKSELLR